MNGPNESSPATGQASANIPRWCLFVTMMCRIILAVAFLGAAVPKINNPQEFADQINLHSDVPPALAGPAIHVLPWLELTCGLCLLVGFATREAALLVALLLVSFLVYHLLRNAENTCGCFLFSAAIQAHGRWWDVVIDFTLALMCLPVLIPRDNSSTRQRS
jgi:uncharacterized membrane protein YphA (DoxX/SURF4 family)